MSHETGTEIVIARAGAPTEVVPITPLDSLPVCKTVKEQIILLTSTTPPKYIKTRQGRGGLALDYIETNYVIARLNATFFFNWNVETLWHEINWKEGQVAVRVRLTAKFADGKEIIKEAFGGSDVKRTKTGELIDFADDLKASESDALKKAASMLGIGWDVYAGIANKEEAAADDNDDYSDTPTTKKLLPDDKDLFSDGLDATPDPRPDFKTIPLTLSSGKVIKVDKFEVLAYFAKIKEALGKEIYYGILALNGFKHANEIPPDKIAAVYQEYIKAWKSRETGGPNA